MSTESNHAELRLNNDPWLLRGLVGAVEHFAHRAGLDDESCRSLITATEQACENTFQLLPDGTSTLLVAIQDYPDRVEVAIEHKGEELPSAGLDTFAGFGAEGDLSGLLLMAHVDRVQYQTEGGTSRMTLVKYVHASSAKP